MPLTLFDKLWQGHLVAEPAPGVGLLFVDHHYVHDLHSGVFDELRRRGLTVRSPQRTIAIADHAVSSAPGRRGGADTATEQHVVGLRTGSRRWGIRHIDANDHDQGIIHVVGPELGLTQPGMLIACGDSHTTTHGALGAMALGIGSTAVLHVLATQTVMLRKPRTMRITVTGALPPAVQAKDLILHLIGRLGTADATGCSLEFAGPAIEAMGIEQRLTLCNLSIEMGAVHGIIGADHKTMAHFAGRPHAPSGAHWSQAVRYWRTMHSDADAAFDREERVDAGDVHPQVTWGTSPQQVVALTGRVPDPQRMPAADRAAAATALDYMGLVPGQAIAGTPVDHVFIGSCANGRLSDLRLAAAAVRGLRVHERVRAWVVPGSQAVKRDAQAEGLDQVFRDAGFEWREPGCSMCVGSNGDLIGAGKRCVSTSNRNFVGRQGPGARTHLANPVVAAITAILGEIPGEVAMRSTEQT